ncbi:Zn-ribbon domain-containing OB-fold protein [Pseudonocardia sp. NPDC049154]|uniref:Zn-ribbon domain-containing OB-fold protein n=1 Tax=Pseudonocardia sp. NPDC049154 TaxID=3155501 RepID=UPI0034074445
MSTSGTGQAPGLLEIVDDTDWTRPTPGTDPLAVEYFRRCAEGTLSIERCADCGSSQHYPRGICMACGAVPDLVPVAGTGTVYSFTIVRQSGTPPFADMLPYVLALVDLDEGPRLMGNITDCDPTAVTVGARVQAYMLRATQEIAIPLWRLAES